MSNIDLTQVTSWARPLKAARRTQGLEDNHKEPSRSWVAKMLLAEHSPIRLKEYEWVWHSIKQWITVHLVRHFIGCEKFVHSQRQDRRELEVPRDELPQGSENDMMMCANAQALINISRKRLCSCASAETRAKWQEVKDAMWEQDPIMASRMVPECQYRGFCPEFFKDNCGYFMSKPYIRQRLDYCCKCDPQKWAKIADSDFWISDNGVIISEEQHENLKSDEYVFFKDSPTDYRMMGTVILTKIGERVTPVAHLMCRAFGAKWAHELKNSNPFDLSLQNVGDNES